MGLILLLLAVALVSLLAGVALVFSWLAPIIERHLIFQPIREVAKTPTEFGVPYRQFFIDTADGCRLCAWHMCPAEPRAAILYFHGNRGNLGLFNEVFQLLYRLDLQVLAIDYRGYGLSTGRPSEKGVQLDVEAAATWFRRHLSDSLPLIYWGRSLGGCFAAYASRQRKPDGLILETAFPSKASMLQYFPQFRPFRIFSRCRLDTVRHLRGHRFPVLVLHGDQDRTVPLEQGRRLFEMLTGPKDLWVVEGADHVNIHRIKPDDYRRRILGFVEECRPPTIH